MQEQNMDTPQDGPEAESGRQPEQFRQLPSFKELIVNIEQLEAIDPSRRAPDWQISWQRAHLERDHLFIEAGNRGLFSDLNPTLDNIYQQTRVLRNTNPAEAIRIIRLLRREDVESYFWKSPRFKTQAQWFAGARDYYLNTALDRNEQELLEFLEMPIGPRLPVAGWEWDLREAETKRRREWERGQKFIHHLESGGGFELEVYDPVDVRVALKSLLTYFEKDLKRVDSDTAEGLISERDKHLRYALKKAIASVGLPPGETEERLIWLFEARLLFIGAEAAAKEGNVDTHRKFMLHIANNVKEYMGELCKDVDSLVLVAAKFLEENNGEYFRLSGVVTNQAGKTKNQLEEEMILNLARQRFDDRLEKGQIKLDQAKIVKLKDLFTRSRSQEELHVELEESKIAGEDEMVLEAGKILVDVGEVLDVAERILNVLGVTNRYAGPYYELDLGRISSPQPYYVIDTEHQKWRIPVELELYRQFNGVIPMLNFEAGNQEMIKDAVLNTGILKNQSLERMRKIMDPKNRGLVLTLREVLKNIGTGRRDYFQAFATLRQQRKGEVKYGAGGTLATKRLFYMPEYIRSQEEWANAEGLIDATELYVRDFMMEVGCWTLQNLMDKLENPAKEGGNLLAFFEFGYWLFRIKGAEEQRDRLLTKATDGSLGFIKQPVKDVISITLEENSSERRQFIRFENVLTWYTFLKAALPTFENVLALARGFLAYLNDRAPVAHSGEYAAAVFINNFSTWLDSKECQKLYPKHDVIRSKDAKKALLELARFSQIIPKY